MTDNKYKAFISYSHRDESWAKWLHKALESYRIPRRLQGPAVPARLFPVFRDRDELSSAADLSEKVQEALKASESLVVICSPDSARSRWVNEEIRLFRSLGRGDRIFSLIVDGDPGARDPGQECFPPALVEGVAEGREPLAADARKWADGKTLAKLKLVSGMLGLRLDELRRREQRRKRQAQAAWMVAALAAVGLVSVAVVSQIKQRAQRESTEVLVSQVVTISEDLNSKVDLETLKTLSEVLQGYLEKIDPGDLTPESSKQVALVLRQLGSVNKAQGRLGQAMQFFEQSRDVMAGLVERHPENLEFMHELGNAEFYVSSIHIETLDYESAQESLFKYRDLARRLEAAEPDNPAWIMEVSYAHTNLAALAERSGKTSAVAALHHMTTAVEYIEKAMELEPGNVTYKEEYVGTLSWLADAQMRLCHVEDALATRQKNESMARAQKHASPANDDLKKEHAYALTGLASVQKQAGLIGEASRSLGEAKELLQELILLDPSNDKYQWEALRRSALIADLESDTDRLDSALMDMQVLREDFIEVLESNKNGNPRRISQFAQFLLEYSSAAMRAGDTETARKLVDEAIYHLKPVLEKNENHRSSKESMALASTLWRALHGSGPSPVPARFVSDLQDDRASAWSCQEANILTREAILNNHRALALKFTSYLQGLGYQDPEFMLFCRRYELCDPP